MFVEGVTSLSSPSVLVFIAKEPLHLRFILDENRYKSSAVCCNDRCHVHKSPNVLRFYELIFNASRQSVLA